MQRFIMSYPPPPGLKSSQSQPQQPSSLPARPPPSAHPQPAFPPGSSSRNYGGSSNPQGGGGSSFGFQPRAVAANSAQSFRTNSPVVSAGPAPPSHISGPTVYPEGSYQQPYQQPAGQSYYPQQSGYDESYAQPTPPQIRNPFPLPGQNPPRGFGGQNALDPEMEAQIAQWQSAYISKDDSSSGRNRSTASGAAAATGANSGPLGNRHDAGSAELSAAADPDTGVASIVTGADGKQKTVVRSGGGQTWQDPSLLEWDPAHFRLFVGNLAGEVTDESLFKAFSRYTSVQKARVIRDKRTTKSRGFGFVSFSDGDEYFQAARDMQGKYIGSHPVLLRKSTTEIRPTVPRDKKKGGKGGKGGGVGAGDHTGGGVHKKQNKTKGGLKILG